MSVALSWSSAPVPRLAAGNSWWKCACVVHSLLGLVLGWLGFFVALAVVKVRPAWVEVAADTGTGMPKRAACSERGGAPQVFVRDRNTRMGIEQGCVRCRGDATSH